MLGEKFIKRILIEVKLKMSSCTNIILISTEFHDLIVLIIKSSANCRTVIDHENIFLQQNDILKNTAHITLYFHHFEEF